MWVHASSSEERVSIELIFDGMVGTDMTLDTLFARSVNLIEQRFGNLRAQVVTLGLPLVTRAG